MCTVKRDIERTLLYYYLLDGLIFHRRNNVFVLNITKVLHLFINYTSYYIDDVIDNKNKEIFESYVLT